MKVHKSWFHTVHGKDYFQSITSFPSCKIGTLELAKKCENKALAWLTFYRRNPLMEYSLNHRKKPKGGEIVVIPVTVRMPTMLLFFCLDSPGVDATAINTNDVNLFSFNHSWVMGSIQFNFESLYLILCRYTNRIQRGEIQARRIHLCR